MFPKGERAIRLFRVFGIQVYLHWSWFLVAFIQIQRAKGSYHNPAYAVLEYVALFAIVLMHEFGHALACRQTGGQAEQIVLWPLGGVAYVNPPPRPGAHLWSLAAGPLVNVALFPLLYLFKRFVGPVEFTMDQYQCVRMLYFINLGLLIFNLLPIYPLDGGQILQSLLWFKVGRAKSLMIATVVGLLGCVGLGALALFAGSIWLGVLVLYAAANCWKALQFARRMLQYEIQTGLRF